MSQSLSCLLLVGLVSVAPAAVREEQSLQGREPWLHIYSDRAQQSQLLPVVNVKCGLSGAGLHRSLMAEVRLAAHGTLHPCQDAPFLLLENITRDMYIDLDQISALTGFGGPQVIASAPMDTERPAAISSDHMVLVYSHLHDNQSRVELPIHFRYQVPGDTLYKLVDVPAPLVFLQCQVTDSDPRLPKCKGPSAMRFPCSVSSREWCLWEHVNTPDQGEEDLTQLQAAIPRGLGSHATVMVALTVLATLAGALYLAYTMLNSH